MFLAFDQVAFIACLVNHIVLQSLARALNPQPQEFFGTTFGGLAFSEPNNASVVQHVSCAHLKAV